MSKNNPTSRQIANKGSRGKLAKSNKLHLAVHGTHCSSCEVLIESKLNKVAGVESVKVNQAKGRAEIAYSAKPSLEKMQQALAGTGYSVSLMKFSGNITKPDSPRKNSYEEYLEIGYAFLIVVTVYLVLKRFDILPKGLSVNDNMSYPFIFAIGLVAALSSCIAVTGGLLVAVAGRYAETHPNLVGWQKFKPQLYFNLGRVFGYAILGGLVGAVGSVFTLSTRLNGVLIISASLIMITLGFQLLNLLPGLRRLIPRMPKFFAHRVHEASGSTESKTGLFVLGASTFFLPCGFTQALQLYVLSRGSFAVGSLTMLVFSLGTLPSLLSLSALTSYLKGGAQKYFFRIVGVIVILLGFSNLKSGFALVDVKIDLSPVISRVDKQNKTVDSANLPTIVDGKQIIRMKVIDLDYEPSRFTVWQGIPVEWHIDGSQTGGCAGIVTAPDLNITVSIAGKTDKVVTFTPEQTGTFAFSCPMAMTTRGASITVVPKAQ